MNWRFKEHITPNIFMIGLSMLFLLFGIGVVFLPDLLSDFLIVPVAAFYALVLWFLRDKKLLCAILPLPILVISVFDGIGAVLTVCFSLCIGLILWKMYCSRSTKFDTVLAITAVFTLYLLLSLFLAVGAITQEYTLDAFSAYYEEYIEAIRIELEKVFSELHILDKNGTPVYQYTEEDAEKLSFSIVRSVFSFFVITAFFLCGLTCKIFSRVVMFAEKDEERIRSWRFVPPTIMVYFYLAVYVAAFFVASEDSMFSGAIQNIFYIFMVIFSYAGLCSLISIISKAQRKGFVVLMVIFLLIFLGASVIQILSFFGAYATIGQNRTQKVQ